MGFYNIGSRGTVSGPEEGDFDPEAACKKLYDGMKGLGTDENAIIEILPRHTNEQRQEIKKKYKTMYGKELADELEKELGGSFAKVVLALLQEPEDYIIDSVHRSVEGLGTDEYSLIGLLCVRSNDELAEMKTQYKEKHGKEMEEDIADDLGGDLKTLMVGLMNGGRDESEKIDGKKVKKDAKDLLGAAAGAGTKEEVFAAIFNQRSASHMREVFDAYKDLADGKELEETVESEFSGNLQNAYLALIKIFRNVVAFHAERLRSAIKGSGTDDDALIQILVTRSEIDLKDILEFYEGKYDSRLVDDVSSDTSGDYRVILQRILDESPTADEGDGAAAAEAPAQSEDAPAEVEEASVEAESAGAESESAPAESEEGPAEKEEAADESEETPTEVEEASVEKEKAAAESEETPTEADEAPAEKEEAPAESKDAPEEAKDAPEESDETPQESGEAAEEAEAAPGESEETPQEESGEAAEESEAAPAESEETPAEEGATESEGAEGKEESAETKEAPAAEEGQEEGESAPAEGAEETAADGKEAPAEAEEASAETEEAPTETEEGTADGDAPAASEDTEKEAEETPAEAESAAKTNAEPKENGENEDADEDAEKKDDDEDAEKKDDDEEAEKKDDDKKDGDADGTENGEEGATGGDDAAPQETTEEESKTKENAVEEETPAKEKKSDNSKVKGK